MVFRLGCLVKVIIIFLLLFLFLIVILNSTWFLKIIYPEPYKEIVEEVSQIYQLDPYLIYAVMRVESKFNPEAQSKKGARGLMQLLPETGSWIARELKYESFDVDKLFDPEYNINLGAWYLSYLNKQFDNNTVLVIAAYNGGETNVKKWLKENIWSGNISDLENIPFKETREYVNKVLTDYETYKKYMKNNYFRYVF